MYDLIFKGIWIVLGLIMLRFYAARKHTIKSVFFGMLSGASALLVLHYFGGRIGFAPPVNLFNTMVSLVLGVPGALLIEGVNLIL